jgi:hypothetical protein
MRVSAGGVRVWLGAMALAIGSGGVMAADRQPSAPGSIEERAKGAERVVVAAVRDVTSRYETNEFGDQLIVSQATLAVEEAIKGTPEAVTITYDGGTVDGVTLRVSSQGVLRPGDRGVFFLTRGRKGEFRPHLKGQGILLLDAGNQVPNSSLTLALVRQLAAGKDQ